MLEAVAAADAAGKLDGNAAEVGNGPRRSLRRWRRMITSAPRRPTPISPGYLADGRRQHDLSRTRSGDGVSIAFTSMRRSGLREQLAARGSTRINRLWMRVLAGDRDAAGAAMREHMSASIDDSPSEPERALNKPRHVPAQHSFGIDFRTARDFKPVAARHPVGSAALLAAGDENATTVWRAGEGGYHTYRIPAVIRTARRGILLAFCEGRRSGRGDSGDIDLLLSAHSMEAARGAPPRRWWIWAATRSGIRVRWWTPRRRDPSADDAQSWRCTREGHHRGYGDGRPHRLGDAVAAMKAGHRHHHGKSPKR